MGPNRHILFRKLSEAVSQSQETWKILLGATPTCDITHGRETWPGESGTSELLFSRSAAEGGGLEGFHF